MKITWNVDPVLFDGPAPLRTYGLLISLAIVGGFLFWRWQMLRGGHGEQTAARFLAYGIVAVIVGARLAHCLFYDLERCVRDPLFVFMIWKGGLASHGALVGLFVALLLFARRRRLPAAEVCDRFSFSAAWGATLVRIGNLFNSEIVGRPTDQSWGVRFPLYDKLPAAEAPLRHPTQIYEAALGLALLVIFLLVDRRLGERRPRGLLGALFLAGYAAGRLALEQFKAYQVLDQARWPLTMGQILSIPVLAWGLIWLLLVVRRRRASRSS